MKVPCLVVYLTEIRTVYHVLFLCYNVYSVPNCTFYFLWFRDLRLERLSPFFLFFLCFFFCYFVFIFFKTFKAFPEIGLLILLVSFSIFLYLIVTSFSESRNDLCPYFSSLSANRSVKFSQFHLNFLLISQETSRPFVQISGRTANAPPKLLSIISTLLPTCAKLSSTIAVWAMITSLIHYNNVKKLVFKVRERLLYDNSFAILR